MNAPTTVQGTVQTVAMPIANGAVNRSSALSARERTLCNGINPWLAPLAMVLTQDVALRGYFRRGVQVFGAEHLPMDGPLLLAPTHRSRWDAGSCTASAASR